MLSTGKKPHAIAGSRAGAPLSYAAAPGAPRRRFRVIPVVELVILVTFAVLPFVLEEYWITFATRVLILSLLAISFDLVWGYAGIMSFGQALFFGTAGYSVALVARDLDITSIFVVIPAATFIGLILSFLLGSFLLLGRLPPTAIF